MADHVHACRTGRFCVFLDLNRDRYFSIPTAAFALLEPEISGSFLTRTHDERLSRPPPDDDTAHLAQSLVAAHILRLNADEPLLAKRGTVTTPPDAVPSLPPSERHRRVGWRSGVRVWRALLQAQYLLYARHLKVILSRTITLSHAFSRLEVFRQYPRSAVDLTLTFAAIRPQFPRNYLCLFDSLALVLFLARHGVSAKWVFAVREDPFDAHCWVQTDTIILNDFADRVAAYTPIMVVPGA